MCLDTHPFKLSGLIDDLQVILGVNKLKPGLKFKLELDPRVPEHLIGDEMRLRQVLTNLGNNAIKFTEHGMVKLMLILQEQSANNVSILFSVKILESV